MAPRRLTTDLPAPGPRLRLHLGTSGYSYAHWARLFYAGVPRGQWLAHYATVFGAVELNTTFYRLPGPGAVDGWRACTPRGFRFAVKGSRYLTHMKRLLDTGQGLDRFFARVDRLGPKLGPVLWQLPPQMREPDLARLDAFLAALPRRARHVVEFRSAGWYTGAVCDVLDRHRAAFCEHDLVGRSPPRHTGGFRYLRFHGTTGRYRGRYGRRALSRVARDLLARGGEAWVFFNNDLGGHALMDALDLAALIDRQAGGRARLAPGRTVASFTPVRG